MNERNVCIGDIISVGPEVLLQVSLPRQPCFKLNHRFSLKNFAPVTYQTSRTGWYYRVVREGNVNVGDDIRLVERRWPRWTIEQVQEYLHRDTTNLAMNEELAEIEALGEESRGQFRSRVAKARRKKRDDAWRDFEVVSRRMETPRVVSLVFRAVKREAEAEGFALGSHARLKLPNGLVRSYSLVATAARGDEDVGNSFELGVALDQNSRGASRYLHEAVKVGDVMQVGRITTDVVPAKSASMHVLIAGGIGITAFLALIKAFASINWAFHLHYAVPSAEDIPFGDRLEPLRKHITIYNKSKGERMDIGHIVKTLPWNSHLYVCGPKRMMEATKVAVDENCIPAGEVHYEAFAADVSGDAFEAEVANKGRVVQVGEDESLLEALRREFGEVPSSCEVGNCGTCKIQLKSGLVHHRGVALLPKEKESSILSCVSRGVGRITIEV